MSNSMNQSDETINNVIRDFREHDIGETTVNETISKNLTQIQVFSAVLVHVATKVEMELPAHLSEIHVGKPNDQVPPHIDISGFPHSQVVSRIHADIIRENDDFYIEDTGSANGTYINHTPLPTGNRHLLKSGDRIAFGKEDKVSFIFLLKDKN